MMCRSHRCVVFKEHLEGSKRCGKSVEGNSLAVASDRDRPDAPARNLGATRAPQSLVTFRPLGTLRAVHPSPEGGSCWCGAQAIPRLPAKWAGDDGGGCVLA